MFYTLFNYNNRNNTPLSNEKIRQAVSRFMAEKGDEERDAERNANNVTMYTFFHQFPVMTNTQGDIANVTKRRRVIRTFWKKR